MSDDAKTKIERDIDSKTKALQRDTQDTSADYEEEMGKVYQEMGNKMLQIIEQYSYQNGYAVVLDVSNQQTPVIWAAPSANIIADIIKLYDQAHPGLPAAKPAAQAPAKSLAPPTFNKQFRRWSCSRCLLQSHPEDRTGGRTAGVTQFSFCGR